MAFAPVLALASTGFQMAGGLMAAQGKADAASYSEAAAQRAAEYGRIQADQTDTRMRQDMAGQLANISAIRASANTDASSPTQAAITSRVSAQNDLARQQKVDNINAQVGQDESAAAFYRQSGQDAVTGGYLGLLGSAASGLGGAYKSNGNSFNFFGG